jgi:predicted phage-related endonuclease
VTRTGFIGGSDIAAVLNLEPYGCARRLWYIKTGATPDREFKMSSVMQMGVWAEDGIARMVEERTGWTLRRREKRQEAHEGVHIDRDIVGSERKTTGIAEIKCIGQNSYWTWIKEGVPVGYLLQLQWGMMLWERSWGAIAAWNRDTGELHVFEFDYDAALVEAVRDRVAEFWQMVETEAIRPALPMDDDRCEDCQFKTSCFESQWANVADNGSPRMDHLFDALVKYQAFRGIEKEAIEKAAEQRAIIEAEMKDNELIQIGAVPVSWKVQTSWRLDEKAMPPEIKEQYKRKIVSRVFRTHKEK